MRRCGDHGRVLRAARSARANRPRSSDARCSRLEHAPPARCRRRYVHEMEKLRLSIASSADPLAGHLQACRRTARGVYVCSTREGCLSFRARTRAVSRLRADCGCVRHERGQVLALAQVLHGHVQGGLRQLPGAPRLLLRRARHFRGRVRAQPGEEVSRPGDGRQD
eukprot:4513036-Prymnesium_polylepis.1